MMMKTAALSALLALLPAVALAAPADAAAQLKEAVTAVQRLEILKDDSDFVFDFKTGKPTKGAGGALIAANAGNFPALIGNGLAMTIGQMDPCSMNSPHTHPRATEFLLMTKGTISAGFLAENGARFIVNNVTELSATIFPAGSIHFQANYGCEPATFVAALNHEDPGTLQVAQRFFGLPPDVVGASLGGLGVQEVAELAGLIPDNVIAATKDCFVKCGLTPPASQGVTQQQPRVSGNAFPSGVTSTATTPGATATGTATSTWTQPSQTGNGGKKVIEVAVGKDGGLTYQPDDITASVGDIVRFTFYAKNHTVTQSAFDDPCMKLPNYKGFDSGFRPVPAGTAAAQLPQFNVTVTTTDPIWFYCQQKAAGAALSHCQQGMNGAINAPKTGSHTLPAFKTRASSSD